MSLLHRESFSGLGDFVILRGFSHVLTNSVTISVIQSDSNCCICWNTSDLEIKISGISSVNSFHEHHSFGGCTIVYTIDFSLPTGRVVTSSTFTVLLKDNDKINITRDTIESSQLI